MDTVKEWLNEGETYDSISGAIEIALFANRKNINYMDQILAEYRMKRDMDTEGISVASNNKWSQNLTEDEEKVLNNMRYRDPITEGYNFSPNFFIRATICFCWI